MPEAKSDTQPSREMVLRLAEALEIPLRELVARQGVESFGLFWFYKPGSRRQNNLDNHSELLDTLFCLSRARSPITKDQAGPTTMLRIAGRQRHSRNTYFRRSF